MELFAGIGGSSYAGKLIGNWRTVCYVEWDEYCQKVIKARIQDGTFDDAPIWDDIQTFDGIPWRGAVDIITGGFPCQPFSVAGKQKGADDERNMWPDTLRVISEVRPRFAFLENVPALLTSGYFGRVIGDLSEIGYDCRWTIVSAESVGAWHKRERLWILAYPHKARELQQEGTIKEKQGWPCNGTQEVSDTGGNRSAAGIPGSIEGQEGDPEIINDDNLRGAGGNIWGTEPPLVRLVHGFPGGGERINALGNAWVPAVACTAWTILTKDML